MIGSEEFVDVIFLYYNLAQMDTPPKDKDSAGLHNNELLDSWKSIAAYLQKDVRTCQRWEKMREMPIHRIGQTKRVWLFPVLPNCPSHMSKNQP